MQVGPGTRLGPYELEALVGAGGMGAVYRARDTRLSRNVAIKVLPAGLHADPQQRERLAREARAISALSHPNICPLYDIGSSDGIDYLVMELLDGESLAERLRRERIPIAQAVTLAIDIALALDAAHRAGLVHRDLKPGNIMLTRNGARLLDFGLAKVVSGSPLDGDAVTTPAPLTREGTVVGTLRYMAPEQLEGRTLDSRTDLYAFGLVLQEMLSSHSDVSPMLQRIVDRCLEKNPDDRWQSARDLAEALRWTREPMAAMPARVRRRNVILPVAAAVALLAAGAAWILTRGGDDRPLREVRFSISPPPEMTFAQNPILQELAISPDGRTLAMAALVGQRRKLFVRALGGLSSRELQGTDGAGGIFWSPDSRWIGFFAGGAMKKVPADGGPVQTIVSAQGSSASWGFGKILFTEWGTETSEAVRIVDEGGGPITDVTDGKKSWGLWPSFLPDGEHFVFFALFNDAPSGLYVGSIDDPADVRLIVHARSRGEVRGDDLYYVRDSVLVRQPFDRQRAVVKGDPVAVADSVFSFAPLGTANFSVSADGSVIAFQRIPLATQLVWRDFTGRELSRVGKPELYRHFSISPDGQRIAADVFDKATGVSNIHMIDVDRGVMTAITSNSVGASAPFWLQSGNELIITAGTPKEVALAPAVTVLSLASGAIRRLRRAGDGPQYATGATAGDRDVLYTVNHGRFREIEMIPLTGNAEPTRLGAGGTHDESDATLSPDQRLLAFQSDESGRPEIYVRPFRMTGEKVRVSTEGGTEPQWSSDGRMLFYVNSTGVLMNAQIAPGERPRVIRESAMFSIDSAHMMELLSLGVRHYVVAGDRVLVREIPGHFDVDPVTVIATP